MKRRSASAPEIFSLSALDLFASAMGAFVVLAILMMPSYLNVRAMLAAIDQLRIEMDQHSEEIDAISVASIRLEKIQEETEQLEEERISAALENAKLKQKLAHRLDTRFLGITTSKRSITILVDLSGSMRELADSVTETVRRLVDSLTDQHEVQLVGFRLLRDVEYLKWSSEGPREATASNKQSIIAFAKDLKADMAGGKPIYAAMTEALKSETDVVVLLTNGLPPPVQNSRLEPSEVIAEITAANTGVSKEIHAVALGNDELPREFINFMMQMAGGNAGQFQAVLVPDQ